MKMTDLRAKARAIFGPAIAEPMPKQPNGAKALQERANARPIPTYKVGGAVKKNAPPQPTAADREAERKRREEYAKMKVTKEQGEAITRGNRAAAMERPGYKMGGKVAPKPTQKPDRMLTSDEFERRNDKLRQKDLNAASKTGKPTGYSSSMKNGGKAKKDGLAVMIAIGEPKKPAKKMGGEMMKPVKRAVGGAGKTRKGMMK
jgi:hypothetical protein